MNRSLMRSERFKQLEMLLLSHPEGLLRSELARRLDISKPTMKGFIILLLLPLYGNWPLQWKICRRFFQNNPKVSRYF